MVNSKISVQKSRWIHRLLQMFASLVRSFIPLPVMADCARHLGYAMKLISATRAECQSANPKSHPAVLMSNLWLPLDNGCLRCLCLMLY